jgi:CRISPR system Cascade subunit CasC
MKHLELHILQSFPVACLNRDDLNSPKTAIFGGVQRARVSSQSWKRAIRDLWIFDNLLPQRFKGERTRFIIEPLTNAFKALGKTEEDAAKAAHELAAALATKDTELRTKTLFYATPGELQEFAAIYSSATSKPALKKAVEMLIKKAPSDAADIALFGRMVASDFTAKLEGAAMFSHALSTHKVDNEIDFFAAVDDKQPDDQAGAGMTGTLEFNSATYYRFAGINLDMLADKTHLQVLSTDERREVVRAFIEATLQAVPAARKNSMNAATLPGYVLGVVRGRGHPVQLVNAFEKPIRAFGGKGLFELSLEALKAEQEKLNKTWGLDKKELFSGAIPDLSLVEFVAEILKHVE